MVDEDGDLEGGNVVVEFGFEMCGCVYKDIVFVVFFEGGLVFESCYLDFSECLFFGVGVGVWYYIVIGFICVDFVVLFDWCNGIDDVF